MPQALRWVAIGASTGGPAAIRDFFEEVPADPPVSFLIVQHIASGFELGFADWLNKEFPLDVRLARDGERPAPAPCGSRRAAPTCCSSPAACCTWTPTPRRGAATGRRRTSCSSPAPSAARARWPA